MKKSAYFFFSMIVGLVLLSCSENEIKAPTSDQDFFPLQVGSFSVFSVEETQYSLIQGQTDLIYDLKLSVIDSFQNNSGGITYVIHRSTRQEGQTEFTYLDTWSARLENDRIVVSEGNTSFVKLAFPVVVGKQWNGNELNNLGGDQSCSGTNITQCDLYQVAGMDIPVELGGEVFTETVEVELNNNPDLIVKQDIRREVYARNVGLILKETTILEYCTVGDCVGKQEIETGIVLRQTLKNYGKE